MEVVDVTRTLDVVAAAAAVTASTTSVEEQGE